MESILLSIQQKREQLTKTELQIADYILNDPEKIITVSIQELSQLIPTSASSIVRFSQKFCGEGGFSALKLGLSAEVSNEQQLYQEISPEDSLAELKDKLSFRIEQSLHQTGQTLDINEIKQASKKIFQAQNIIIFGVGASMVAASDLQQKLIRIGKTVTLLNNPHLIATMLIADHQKSVLILISNSGQTKEVIQLAKLAKKQEISIIAITQNQTSKLFDLADNALVTETTTENESFRTAATTSLFSQLFVIDLLYYDYFTLDFENNRKYIQDSHQFIQKNYREG